MSLPKPLFTTILSLSHDFATQYDKKAKSEQDARSHAIIKAQDRIKVLERMVGRLYEDIATGKITQSNFDSLIAKAQSEQEALEKQIAETQKVLGDTAIRESDARQWAEHIKEYANIRELDRETLNRLVRTIIVHEEIDDEKNRNINKPAIKEHLSVCYNI